MNHSDDQRRKAGDIPGQGVSWQKHGVTHIMACTGHCGGRGAGGTRKPGGRGHGSRETRGLGGRTHAGTTEPLRAPCGATLGKASPAWKQAPGRQQSVVGFCHQLSPQEGLLSRSRNAAGQGNHEQTPMLAPGSSQYEGVLLPSTHLAPVPRSPSLPLLSPDPGTGGHSWCCQPLPGQTAPDSQGLPRPPGTPGLRAPGVEPQAPPDLANAETPARVGTRLKDPGGRPPLLQGGKASRTSADREIAVL